MTLAEFYAKLEGFEGGGDLVAVEEGPERRGGFSSG